MRGASVLVQVVQERAEVEALTQQLRTRGNNLSNDYQLQNQEIDRFNGQCAGGRTFPDAENNAEYRGCQTWQIGLGQRQQVLDQNAQAIVRDEAALQSRDRARVARGEEALRSMAASLARLRTFCANRPAGERTTYCHHLDFDPRIQGLMAELETLATNQRDCPQQPTPEQMAACARVPFDGSRLEPARPVIFPNFRGGT